MKAFLFGLGLGIGLGVLFAPMSGQEARDNLHMCFPSQTCYEVIYPPKPHAKGDSLHAVTPWYGRLWESVAAADTTTPR